MAIQRVFNIRTVLKSRRYIATVELRADTLSTYLCLLSTDAIKEAIDRVYYCLGALEMPSPIEDPADCEIDNVIRFLSAKVLKAVGIHPQVCEDFGQNMKDGMVREWVRDFKDNGLC